MLHLFGRLLPYVYTYLLGLSVLGFCCACYRERLSSGEIAGRVWLACCGSAIVLFLWATFFPLAIVLLLAVPIVAFSVMREPRRS